MTIVLVAEDEPLLRLGAVDLFESWGYAVLEAADAAEALRLLETEPRVDILFTDVDMPGDMNGIDLIHLVRNRAYPIRKIVIASAASILAEVKIPEGVVTFSKPYDVARIREVFASVNDQL